MRIAALIRRLAELYGYTPTEIADMPIRLVDLLITDEKGRLQEINRIGNRTTMTIEEWNRMVLERKECQT